jgi:NADH dehydrogenase FAD-containing subunit
MKNIVIIGGGFAGSHAAKKLEKIQNPGFQVTLIDKKEYFEFTPSILKAITSAKYLNKIHIKHKEYLKRSEFILGKADKITENYVQIKNFSKKIPYDYLIIATGSYYFLPFKNHKSLQINRGEDIKKYNKYLQESNKITIIGGGIVGVELAGEISDFYKNKKIELIESKSSLIQRSNKKTQEYSKRILEKKGVKIILNKSFKQPNSKNKNEELIFTCTGIKPNLNFKFSPKDISLETNKYLQLNPHRNIFIVGDVSNIKEEKTAQNAIKQANVAIENIKRIEKDKPLKNYTSKKNPQLISLGKNKGIFEYKNFVMKGKIPIIIKNFIEKREMRKLKN